MRIRGKLILAVSRVCLFISYVVQLRHLIFPKALRQALTHATTRSGHKRRKFSPLPLFAIALICSYVLLFWPFDKTKQTQLLPFYHSPLSISPPFSSVGRGSAYVLLPQQGEKRIPIRRKKIPNRGNKFPICRKFCLNKWGKSKGYTARKIGLRQARAAASTCNVLELVDNFGS